MAYKIFRQGEPPSQRDLQMLMDQGVIVASSTQRPFAPHEGMLIYEIDTNGYKWYNGTTWVSLGSVVDAWVSGNNLSVPGNVSAGGTLSATGNTTLNGTLVVGGDSMTVGGHGVNRLVDGKTVGSVSHTGDITARTNIPGANSTNVSVIAGRAYRASGMVSCYLASGTAGHRGALELWNGTVGGGGKCGGTVNIRFSSIGTFQSYPFAFVWEAPTTEIIANLNLSLMSVDASPCRAQTDDNYFMIVEHLGSASDVTGL